MQWDTAVKSYTRIFTGKGNVCILLSLLHKLPLRKALERELTSPRVCGVEISLLSPVFAEKLLDTNLVSNLQYAHVCLQKTFQKTFH